MTTEESKDNSAPRTVIGILAVTAFSFGILGLAAGRAIWKEEKVPPHGSLVNTNHEVLLPSTQHLIARLAKIDRDLDQMLAWTSNANALVRDAGSIRVSNAVYWAYWTNAVNVIRVTNSNRSPYTLELP